MTGSLIERVRERLASESGPLRPSVVAAAIRAESGGMLGDTEVLANLRVLQTELTGAGILEPLLSADGTTDVLVTAPDSVWVDDGNGLRRSQIRFADESAVRRLAQRLALAAGRRLDDAQPWVDGQLTGIGVGGFAVRLHAVLPPVATQGTCLSLRVLRPATQDLAAYADVGPRLELLADVVTHPTLASAPVVAAVAHGELLTLRPFGCADGVVARAVSRLVTIATGLDPHGLGVPEVIWMRQPAEYHDAARRFAGGTPDGVAGWLLLCCGAMLDGAREALSIAESLSPG